MLAWSKFKWRQTLARPAAQVDPDTLTIAGEQALIAGQTVEMR